MDVVSTVKGLGGISTRAALVARCGQRAIDRALRAGDLVRVARGRYAVREADPAVRAAGRYAGVVSMRSAALRHGWQLRLAPDLPDVTFPRNRHLQREARKVLVPHWSALDADEVEAGATTKRRTLIDCMRNLPLHDSVPIVDSAVRAGDITPRELTALASSMRGRGRARAMAVAAMATAAAANAFESTLRAIAATVPGLDPEPQAPIRIPGSRYLQPDLTDLRLRLVVEAEGFEWHGESAALTRDCERYNTLVNLGFTVIRFSWSQVIFRPAYVVEVLVAAVARARRHANVAGRRDGVP